MPLGADTECTEEQRVHFLQNVQEKLINVDMADTKKVGPRCNKRTSSNPTFSSTYSDVCCSRPALYTAVSRGMSPRQTV